MANEVKKYFLAPSWDYPPSGPISLGSIVRTPEARGIVPPLYAQPDSALNLPCFKSSKTDWRWVSEGTRDASLGIWMKFLQFTGLGVDAGISDHELKQREFVFDRVDTQEFLPDDEFVRGAFATPAVRNYVTKSLFSKSVYMIVGIKTVKGAKAITVDSRYHSSELNIGIDGTLPGTTYSFGPEGKVASGRHEVASFGSSTDFVFAFRLRRIKVDKNHLVYQKDYDRGAVLGDGSEQAFASAPEAYTVHGVTELDAGADDFDMDPACCVVEA